MYFVISNSGGDTYVSQRTKEQLLQYVQEMTDPDLVHEPAKIMSEIEESDTNYWNNGVLIIKGEIIIPRAAEKVTVWEID